MGWPKGVSRKGYVTKSGEQHAKRGSKLRAMAPLARPTNGRASAPAQRKVAQAPSAPARDESGQRVFEVRPEWKSLLRWSGDRPMWTAFCPACEFPEADGGHCPACGWTAPIVLGQRY